MMNHIDYCNKAIRSFGINIFYDIFKKVNEKYNLPIISVGSGNGADGGKNFFDYIYNEYNKYN